MNKNIVDIVTLFYHIIIKSLSMDRWSIYGIVIGAGPSGFESSMY